MPQAVYTRCKNAINNTNSIISSIIVVITVFMRCMLMCVQFTNFTIQKASLTHQPNLIVAGTNHIAIYNTILKAKYAVSMIKRVNTCTRVNILHDQTIMTFEN